MTVQQLIDSGTVADFEEALEMFPLDASRSKSEPCGPKG